MIVKQPGTEVFPKAELMDELSEMYKKDMEVLSSEVFERLTVGEDTIRLAFLI